MAIKARIFTGMGNKSATPMTGADQADFMTLYQNFLWREGILLLAADHFQVQAQTVPDMSVKVKKGQSGFIKDPAWALVSDNPKFTEFIVDADVASISIAANSSGSTRYDLIYAYINTNTPNDDASNVITIDKLQGTPGGSLPTPAGGTKYISLAQVRVTSGAVNIQTADITDLRQQTGIALTYFYLLNNTMLKAVKADGTLQDLLKLSTSNVVDLDDTAWTHAIDSQHLNALSGTVQATADTSIPNASTDYDITGCITPLLTPVKTGVIRLKGFQVWNTGSASRHNYPGLWESVNGGAYAYIGGAGIVGGPQSSDTLRRPGHVLAERTMTVGNTYRYKMTCRPDATIASSFAFSYGCFLDYDVIR